MAESITKTVIQLAVPSVSFLPDILSTRGDCFQRWTRTERRRLYEWLVKSAKRSLGVSQLASVARDDLGLEGRSVMAIACQIRMVRSMSMDAVQEWIAQGH